jgi:glycosyltransferase involved in cell wall biosynthesis
MAPLSKYKSILVIRANAVSDFRMDLAARYLRRAGYDVETITVVPFYKAGQYDAVICCRPGSSMIEWLNCAYAAGTRVVIDLDDDFNATPKHNPAYQYTGAGNPTYLNELKKVLHHPGTVVTYASPILADRYKADGIVVPNCWDDENPNWKSKKLKRKTVNIGFSGTSTHREDFNICERAVKSVMERYPDTRLVISGDDQIYERFTILPESRRMFIPGVPYDDYPLVYRYIDILLVPLRDTHFNRAKSDIKLLEAGATHTSWLASDLPFYRNWGVGGSLVADGDWEQQLTFLIENKGIRALNAEQGYEKATYRAGSLVCQKWVEIMGELLK